MDKKKRIYSKEFKDKVVSLSHRRENLKELADELNINVERIYKWRRAQKEDLGDKDESAMVEPAEVKQLKKELREALLELEILKKAVHIFSRSDGKSIRL
jgi:transposase